MLHVKILRYLNLNVKIAVFSYIMTNITWSMIFFSQNRLRHCLVPFLPFASILDHPEPIFFFEILYMNHFSFILKLPNQNLSSGLQNLRLWIQNGDRKFWEIKYGFRKLENLSFRQTSRFSVWNWNGKCQIWLKMASFVHLGMTS